MPTVQPPSAHGLRKTKGEGNYGGKSSSARSKFESMALYGDNFERSTKTLAIKNTLKSIDGTGKYGGNCLESRENASVRSPVFCGPCFRPWSKGKKTRKYITRGHYNQPEANVQ